jgi:hypothetical protein
VPGFSGVVGFIDTVTYGEVGAAEAFPAGDVDYVSVRGGDSDCADGLGGLAFKNGVPGASVVIAFPNASVGLSHIEHIGLVGNSGGGTGAAPAKGTDHAQVQIRHYGRWLILGENGGSGSPAGDQERVGEAAFGRNSSSNRRLGLS